MRSPLALLAACGSLVLLLPFLHVACGGEVIQKTDPAPVPTPDPSAAGSTAPTIDPVQPAKLSVRYSDRSGPASDIKVVFHDVAGKVLETTTTDAKGVAVSRQADATQATIVPRVTVGGVPSLLTYTGLEAGDEIVIAPSVEGSGYVQGTLPELAGATRYHLDANECSGQRLTTAGTHIVPLEPCAKDASYTLLGVARDDNNTPLGYASKADVAPAANAALLVWATPTKTSIEVENAGPNVLISFQHVFNGRRVGTYGDAEQLGGSALPVLRIAKAATEIDVHMNEVTKNGDLESDRSFVQRTSAQLASVKVDFASALVAPESLTARIVSAHRPEITWRLAFSAPTLRASGVAVTANWMVPTSDGKRSAGYWTIVAPSFPLSVLAPSLPSEVGQIVPSGDPSILTFEASAPLDPKDATYKSYRTHYRDGASPLVLKSHVRTSRGE